ncbi:hypothetical protein JCM5350_003406 [Sporobolomyces pararoseus]
MVPPQLDLSTTITTFTRPPTRHFGSTSLSASSSSSSSSPVSPTLRSYSDQVRVARRPSWTPKLRDPSTVQVVRPNGLVLSHPELSRPPLLLETCSPTTTTSSILFAARKPSHTFEKEEKNDQHSPSFPFPRMMNRKLRPQPLSAFSTDTTIRSSTCGSEEEESVAGEEMESLEGGEEGHENDHQSLDRIGGSFASLSSTRKRRSAATTSSLSEGEEEIETQAKVYLRASNGPAMDGNFAAISPLTLSNPIEPLSPLSPFGNLALFDALSPLPTPRFDADRIEEVGVSALVMERFEDEGGFPWFSVEGESTERNVEEIEGIRAGYKGKSQNNLDTPPSSKPSSPNCLNCRQPSFRSIRAGCYYTPPAGSLFTPYPPRPPRPVQHDSSFDSWNPFPFFPPPPISPPTLSGSSVSPHSQPATTNHLRRSTQTLTSKLAKPLLHRGRSASLPTTSLTSTPQPLTSSRRVKEKRCKSLGRSLSCSKSKLKKSTRLPTSQIQKSAISSPIPLAHPLEPTIPTSVRLGIDISRPSPTSSFSQYRFNSNSFSTSPTSLTTEIDPFSTCSSFYTPQTYESSVVEL